MRNSAFLSSGLCALRYSFVTASLSPVIIRPSKAALRNAGLVSERREGRFAYYRADPKGLKPLVGWIDRYRSYWPKRIARLKTVLKEIDQ